MNSTLEDRLFWYAERYFQKSGRTKFPTVRECAKALRVRYADIEEAADGDSRLMLTEWYVVPPDPLGEHYVETLLDREEEQ